VGTSLAPAESDADADAEAEELADLLTTDGGGLLRSPLALLPVTTSDRGTIAAITIAAATTVAATITVTARKMSLFRPASGAADVSYRLI
jgi:hypothetical protein